MHTQERIDQTRDLIAESKITAALTGAGISTRSGIPDFRSPGSGLWEGVDIYEVASVYGFKQKPEAFFDWIRPVAQKAMAAEPNAAHLALVELEREGPLKGIITQNIDMLHSKAGSQEIYELHGHWREATCISCYHVYPAEPHLSSFVENGDIPRCSQCGGVLKPNVILYGEQLPFEAVQKSQNLARSCDLMIVAGSSLEVAPACDIPMLALENRAKLIIINLEPTYIDPYADVVIHGDVVDVLPELAEMLPRA